MNGAAKLMYEQQRLCYEKLVLATLIISQCWPRSLARLLIPFITFILLDFFRLTKGKDRCSLQHCDLLTTSSYMNLKTSASDASDADQSVAASTTYLLHYHLERSD